MAYKDDNSVGIKANPFQVLIFDIIDLLKIDRFRPYIKAIGLPRYEYTAIDFSTGGVFLCFGLKRNNNTVAIFTRYILEHLFSFGVTINDMVIKTVDSPEFGSEEGGNKFLKVLKEYGVKYGLVSKNNDIMIEVEYFHKLIENEFYNTEDFRNLDEFLTKSYNFNIYLNFIKKKNIKDSRSAVEILKENTLEISPQVFNLPPIVID